MLPNISGVRVGKSSRFRRNQQRTGEHVTRDNYPNCRMVRSCSLRPPHTETRQKDPAGLGPLFRVTVNEFIYSGQGCLFTIESKRVIDRNGEPKRQPAYDLVPKTVGVTARNVVLDRCSYRWLLLTVF